MKKTRKTVMSPLMLLMRSLTRRLLPLRSVKAMMMTLRLKMYQIRQLLKIRRRKRRARKVGPMRVSSKKTKIMPQITSPRMLRKTL